MLQERGSGLFCRAGNAYRGQNFEPWGRCGHVCPNPLIGNIMNLRVTSEPNVKVLAYAGNYDSILFWLILGSQPNCVALPRSFLLVPVPRDWSLRVVGKIC